MSIAQRSDGLKQSQKNELDNLRAELVKDVFDDAELAKNLTNLKVLARTPRDAPCVYCKEGIRVLAECAFGPLAVQRPSSSLEAARILANALLLRDEMQQVLADTNYVKDLLDFYGWPSVDHEFVGGRILFLLTYKSKIDFTAIIESRRLLDSIRNHLEKHCASLVHASFQENEMNSMALVETLKLLYNLASKYPGQMHFFSTTTKATIGIIRHLFTTSASRPLDPPVAQVVNVLAIIDWPASLIETGDSLLLNFARKLVELLDQSTSALKPAQLETMLIPLITVIRKLNEISHTEVNQLLRSSLLPQDEERDKPLGKSKTLAARLLGLQTSGGLTILPDAISGLLFDLSDRNATAFVHNIGYGHAAGYLMTHKIPIPKEVKHMTSRSTSSNGSTQINPITGQRLDAETPVNMPEMTGEEKEREAERLYVLFERLRATGVVDVENPMSVAQQSGRFEELSDGESD